MACKPALVVSDPVYHTGFDWHVVLVWNGSRVWMKVALTGDCAPSCSHEIPQIDHASRMCRAWGRCPCTSREGFEALCEGLRFTNDYYRRTHAAVV
jgi:hypothetical protein